MRVASVWLVPAIGGLVLACTGAGAFDSGDSSDATSSSPSTTGTTGESTSSSPSTTEATDGTSTSAADSTDSGSVDPQDYTIEQLRFLQGDLMLWVPELKPVYEGDVDPVTGIRRVSDMGIVPEGLANGWIWTLTIDRYPPEDREIIYQAALAEGFTHFAVQVTHCQPSEGYHGLIPVTDEDCVDADDRLNAILHELWDHGLIPLCTGVSPTDAVAPGLDKSLCRVVLNDWDNSAEADCHIQVLAETFPDAQIIFEIPQGAITPTPDACSPMPFPATGAEWIANVQALHPNFFAVAYEVNQPDGLDANQAELEQAHAWWSGVQEIRFEIDTYWKFWENLDHDVARQYNDDLQQRAPWLVGFMSGGTTTAPPPGP
jgi:hypothetical protein